MPPSASKPVGDKLLRKTEFRIRVVGTLVHLHIGNATPLELTYETATNVAHMLHWAGKKAKQNAGDGSMRFLGIADLTDANADEREIQKSRDGTAVFMRAG